MSGWIPRNVGFNGFNSLLKNSYLLRIGLWQGLKPIVFSTLYGPTKVVP